MSDKKHISSLDKIPKKELFQAPEGYFDSLEGRIMEKLPSDDAPKNFNLVPWTVSGIAASVVLFVIGWNLLQDTQRMPSADLLLAEVSDEDIRLYLENADISEFEIIDALEETGNLMKDEELILPDVELQEEDIESLYEIYGITG